MMAHQHDAAMAAADLLSHQVPGEADFGTRLAQAGFAAPAGENVGQTARMDSAGALALESAWVQQGPTGVHGANILSARYTLVGIDVVLDSTNRVLWMTQDFAA